MPTSRPPLTRGLMALLVLFIFATAATIHFQTPMLPEFGRTFDADATQVGWVATMTFSGFLVGILFLVPLGDTFDKRRLVLTQATCMVVALLAMALAPTLPALVAAAVAIGVCASVSQHLVPIVAELAAPNERGRMVGTLLSGLFLGVLFGRVGGGLIASYFGWRWTYAVSATMLIAITPMVAARLPSAPPKARLAYVPLLRSVAQLWREGANLRRASAIQFLLGICYGGFWTSLAQMLLALHGLGPAAAGLIGIPGAAGVLIARPAGQWMDHKGVAPVVTVGITLVIASHIVFGFALYTVMAVVVGVALLDCGLRAAMVANQAFVTSADAATRSRANTIFTMHVWGGNAVGAFVASIAWSQIGWLGVCLSGAAASLTALVVYRRVRPAGARG